MKGSDLVKFFITVAIPMTVWFLTLKHEIDLNSITARGNTAKIEYIRDKQELHNNKMLDKMETLIKDVSIIKGRIEK